MPRCSLMERKTGEARHPRPAAQEAGERPSALLGRARDLARSEGYQTPTIRIHSTDETEIAALCARYTAEFLEWLSDKDDPRPSRFEGTIKALTTLYRKNPDSPYHDLKPNSRAMYDESLDLLEKTVGDRQLARLNGNDFRRWYKKLREPAPPKKDCDPVAPERIRARLQGDAAPAHRGEVRRHGGREGVRSPRDDPRNMRFESPGAREVFVTFEQSAAIIAKAIEMGRPSIAIAQALQFDLTLGRSSDRALGQVRSWRHGIVSRGRRWSGGLVWSEIDADGILRKKTTKTGQEAVHDTKAYPLVAQNPRPDRSRQAHWPGRHQRDHGPALPLPQLLPDVASHRDESRRPGSRSGTATAEPAGDGRVRRGR